MEATAITQESAQTIDIPSIVLQSILRQYVADRGAEILNYTSTPLPHLGTNDSTRFVRVTLTWALPTPTRPTRTATWILKQWRADGERDRMLGITHSREVLAWERGWLHRSALPEGVVVPILGVWRSPDQREAWLALADVSTELEAFPRIGLTAEQAISRTGAILRRLAHFHAHWEEPGYQSRLQACDWLGRPETYLWDMAATYAHALGQRPPVATPPGASAPPVWESLSADLDAFLTARPADERRLWEQLLIDRQPLVEGLAAYPYTLLHNDLDDRNIGLRWTHSDTTRSPAHTQPELVLIDWEWIAQGPAALDVANLVSRLPVLIMLGAPPGTDLPAAVWSDELADCYFTHYQDAGGKDVDRASWRGAYGIALVVQGLAQMPFIHGSLRRVLRGELSPPPMVGIPQEVVRQHLRDGLPIMEQMERRVLCEARHWLG